MKHLNALAWAGLTVAALFGSTASAGTPLPPAIDATVEPVSDWRSNTSHDWDAVVQQAGYTIGVQHGLPAASPTEHLGPLPAALNPVFPQAHPRPQAGLYPSPVQNTPQWIDQTLITNPAFAPHEMLYPHEYHAMYGPFYYKNCGTFIWTPFGMRTHERWKLQGTEVKVKYHDRIKLFSGFIPRL